MWLGSSFAVAVAKARSCSSDTTPSLAWELPYATGAALKSEQTNNKKATFDASQRVLESCVSIFVCLEVFSDFLFDFFMTHFLLLLLLSLGRMFSHFYFYKWFLLSYQHAYSNVQYLSNKNRFAYLRLTFIKKRIRPTSSLARFFFFFLLLGVTF